MWSCPVCNGLNTLQQQCPKCSAQMQDTGKISDYYAPYSPYREIDDLKMTNGFQDALYHQCVHYINCLSCGYEDVVIVKELHV